MKIGRAAWATDTGRRRLHNEDAYVFEAPVFAIADGMGGARAGEVAAGLAAGALREARRAVQGEDSLEAIIVDANRRIWERSVADPATAGMGTTMTVAFVDETGGRVVFGHVGDSRAYRLRGDRLEQVTTDHSLVAELVESGVLTREEAERHPQRSAITRAVGTERAIEADVFTLDVEPGDLFLLCSDGLTDMLAEDEIAAAILSAGGDPESAGAALIAAANARGGEDNITVILFELVEGEAETTETSDAEPTTDDAGGELDAADGRTTPIEGPEPKRHGAGKGGRVAALLLVTVALAVAALAVYWGLKS